MLRNRIHYPVQLFVNFSCQFFFILFYKIVLVKKFDTALFTKDIFPIVHGIPSRAETATFAVRLSTRHETISYRC